MSDLPEGTKPFDRSEIKKCATCKKGIGHAGDIAFYEVRIGQVIVDVKSVREIMGTELIVGNPMIASVMAPTSRIGVRMPVTRLIFCQPCFLGTAVDRPMSLAALWEMGDGDD